MSTIIGVAILVEKIQYNVEKAYISNSPYKLNIEKNDKRAFMEKIVSLFLLAR